MSPSPPIGSPGGSPPNILDRYRGQSLGVRAHVATRWHGCPFPIVERLLPTTGDLLDVGCGHGHFTCYLAACEPARNVLGIDIDEDKLVAARAAAEVDPRLLNVSFRAGSGLDPATGSYDGVVITDVLYLLDTEAQAQAVSQLAVLLRPGGRLVVKEMAPEPRWKVRVMVAQEFLATQVLRITAGATGDLTFTPPSTIAAWMGDAGLTATHHSIAKGSPYPHHAVVGTAPGGAEPFTP